MSALDGSDSRHPLEPLGRYQFQSPSSFMAAGSSTPRMMVASISMSHRNLPQFESGSITVFPALAARARSSRKPTSAR
jgi:hypothetical protein